VTWMRDPFVTDRQPVVNGGNGRDSVENMTAGTFNGGNGRDSVGSALGGLTISVP
jgi:hypothetical protein